MTQVFIDLFIFILLSLLLSNYIFIISKYWPDVQYAETSSDYDSFWEHEWTKHGTCSGLAQATFFQDTINLIEKYGTPSVLTSAAGKTIDADTLRTAMGGKTFVALQCTSQVLNGAYTCWGRDSTSGAPLTQIVCPSSVQSEDTCTSSSTITVPTL